MDIQSVIKALRNKVRPSSASAEDVDTRAAQAKEGAEAIAQKLPSAVMPKAAIAKKRQQMQQIDQQLEEGQK